jgi:hypothetical protein
MCGACDVECDVLSTLVISEVCVRCLTWLLVWVLVVVVVFIIIIIIFFFFSYFTPV